jgi:hypothetical protein
MGDTDNITATDNYCPKCGQAWIVHNPDGSCIDDEALEREKDGDPDQHS